MPRPPEETDIPTPRHTIATNLPAPSTQPLKRRQSRLFRRPQKRPRPSPTPTTDDEDPFASVATLSDLQLALHTLHTAWPHEAYNRLPRTPPLLLLAQVRALVSDSATFDEEVDRLAVGVWRKLVLPGGDEALVKVDDLVRVATTETGRVFAGEVITKVKTPVVWQSLLEEAFESDVTGTLVREGFLTMRDEKSFWLAVPGMGQFLNNRVAGKKEVLSILKRTPYQEMLIAKLEMRTLKKSVFTAQWHVRDVVGAGIAETVATSLGTLVRLRDVSAQAPPP